MNLKYLSLDNIKEAKERIKSFDIDHDGEWL